MMNTSNTSTFPGFPTTFQSKPGIYIPVLFINKERLMNIIHELDLFTIHHIDIHPKILSNGNNCYYAFIEVKSWHYNKNAKHLRKKLLEDEEVKIVFDKNRYFICKRKHDEKMETSMIPSSPPTYIDFSHIVPVRSISRCETLVTPTDEYDDDYCPECEDPDGFVENQLGHTCIQRMMWKEEQERYN